MDISAFLVIPPSMGFQWLLRKAWGMTIPLDPKFSASEMLTAASRAYCKSGIQDSWIQHRQNGIDIKSLENPCYHPIFYPILTGLENHVPWLVVYLPLWKIWKSIGMMKFPIWWKIKSHVPNHQPGIKTTYWDILRHPLWGILSPADIPPHQESRDFEKNPSPPGLDLPGRLVGRRPIHESVFWAMKNHGWFFTMWNSEIGSLDQPDLFVGRTWWFQVNEAGDG